MFCGKCGCKISGKEKFCPQCGKRIRVKKVIFIMSLFSLFILILVIGGITFYNLKIKYEYLAPVCNRNGDWGYINERGEIISCEDYWERAYPFNEDGIAMVYGLGNYFYIDRYGRGYSGGGKEGENFTANGLALARDISLVEVGKEVPDDKFGYINSAEKWEIEPQFDDAKSFGVNGMAAVGKKGTDEDGDIEYIYGYIDESGEMVIPHQYKEAGMFASNGLAPVCNQEGKWGYIDEEGEVIIDFQFNSAEEFGENGLAAVWVTGTEYDNQYGYIDETGEEVISPQYLWADKFNENGLAVVTKAVGTDDEGRTIYKRGIINEDAEEIIPFEYDYIELCGEKDTAIVGKSDDLETWETAIGHMEYGVINEEDLTFKCQYIDMNGNVLLDIPEKYRYVGPFVNVKKGGRN